MVCEIELEIGPGTSPGEFLTRVIHAEAGGEPVAPMQLDVERLLTQRHALENAVLASAVTARRAVPAGEQFLRDVGHDLFGSLFSGPVYGAYRASLGAAQGAGEQLRIVLRLTAPELAALPWEALYDHETGKYVCRREPLVRHVSAPYTPEPLEVVHPLRILALVASPRGLPPLDIPAEQQRLSTALADPIQRGLLTVDWLPDATWDQVHARLLSEEWHVLHFIGHGDYDVERDQGLIALTGSDGRAELVDAERLADLFGEAQPVPRLVVLNSCSGGENGTQDLFSGTAAALVRSGICAVAAMQFTVSDDAAIAFSRGFYTAIAAGRGIDEATRSGRIAILGAGQSLEWVTPVLYLRGETAHLFDVTAPPPPDPVELQTLHHQAEDHLRGGRPAEALAVLDRLLTLEPDYRDSAHLREEAEHALHEEGLRRDRSAQLRQEIRERAEAEDWQAVIRSDEELASVDLSAADPDGLATLARTKLAVAARAAELDEGYHRARAAEDAENWRASIAGYQALLEEDREYRDAALRLDGILRRQRLDRLRWVSVGALAGAVLILVLARTSVLGAVDASRDGLPKGSWWLNPIWLAPCAPALAAAALLAARRSAGIALGCIAAAWLMVAIAFVLMLGADGSHVTAIAVTLLLVALLGVALTAAFAAVGTREPCPANGARRAALALSLVAAAVLLRVLNVHLAQVVEEADRAPGTMSELLGKAAFWVAVLVPLAIGVPASLRRLPAVLATALRTLVCLQVGFELLVRVPIWSDGKVVRGDWAASFFVLGTACLLAAVWIGQWRDARAKREPAYAEPAPGH
jgi:hypothetical protein